MRSVRFLALAWLAFVLAPLQAATLLRFSPDGRTLASNGDGQVLLWDLANPPLAAAN